MANRFVNENPCDMCTNDYMGCESKCKKYQDFKHKKKKDISQQRKNKQKFRNYYDKNE